MKWYEQPAEPVEPAQPAQPPPSTAKVGGFRRGIIVGTMALGLLALGGVAAVSAADPSVSPAPSATTTEPSNPTTDEPSSTARPKGDCPKDGSGRRGSGESPDASPEASPDSSPDASSSDA